ncbi:hypothetical protein NFI96_015423, partial [Prochilodus magdalenae]
VPETSLSRPPWPELPLVSKEEVEKQHRGKQSHLYVLLLTHVQTTTNVFTYADLLCSDEFAVVQKVNTLIEKEEYGRLFAVVHFASRQWKVTSEDLIQIENHIEAECGDRIILEKVLLVGGEDFTLIGKPLLSRDLVRVEATVIEKTDSWPMVHMSFWKRHRFQKKRTIIQPQTVLRINSIEVSPRLT